MRGSHRTLLSILTWLLSTGVSARESIYANSYVIQLHAYRYPSLVQQEVKRALLPSHPEGGSWVFVERKNFASQLPTDFVVLRVSSEEGLDVLRAAPVGRRVTSPKMPVSTLASSTFLGQKEWAVLEKKKWESGGEGTRG